MTMPASGAISMSQINSELGRASTSGISLNYAEDGGYGAINTNSTSRPSSSDPASLSEWYSYNHNALPSISYTNMGYYWYIDPCSGGTVLYYGNDGRWYRTGDGINFTDVTGEFAALYSYFDYWEGYYYSYYNLVANNQNPLYWGDTTSYCAPF